MEDTQKQAAGDFVSPHPGYSVCRVPACFQYDRGERDALRYRRLYPTCLLSLIPLDAASKLFEKDFGWKRFFLTVFPDLLALQIFWKPGCLLRSDDLICGFIMTIMNHEKEHKIARRKRYRENVRIAPGKEEKWETITAGVRKGLRLTEGRRLQSRARRLF